MTDDETWVQLAGISLNARLRNQIELFMMKAPAEHGPGVGICPAGALSEDATAETKVIGPIQSSQWRKGARL